MTKLLLLLFSGAKLGKLLTTGGTMLVSVVAYAFVFGWWYAVGFVALIFVHEMGHYVACKQRGLNVGPVTFLPFVGAWIELKEQPMNVETEAYIAVAGPLAGTVAAYLCYWAAGAYDSQLLLALSYAGFFINLFNLIPLKPFDGGRIASILTRTIWMIGVPMMLAYFAYRPSPMMLLILLLAAPAIWASIRGTGEDARYHEVPTATRMNYGLLYLGLCSYLAVMTYEVHERLGALR